MISLSSASETATKDHEMEEAFSDMAWALERICGPKKRPANDMNFDLVIRDQPSAKRIKLT